MWGVFADRECKSIHVGGALASPPLYTTKSIKNYKQLILSAYVR